MFAPVKHNRLLTTRHVDDRETHLHSADNLESLLFCENRILAALPFETYKRLLPHLELVHLPTGRILYNAGDIPQHAYFLKRGMVSMLSTVEDGRAITVALIGKEGMVGVSLILRAIAIPYQMTVAVGVEALRIRGHVLQAELGRNLHLQESLLRYAHTVLSQISHSVACNRFHTVEARLCCWLLLSHDCLRTNSLKLTQEFLSQLLGVPRTSITIIAGRLQKAGLIRYSRGRIEIVNRQGLESFSCECYRTVREEAACFLAA